MKFLRMAMAIFTLDALDYKCRVGEFHLMNNDILLTDLAHALTKLQRITHFTLHQIQSTITDIAASSSPPTNHQPPALSKTDDPTTLLLKIHDDLREIQSEYCCVADHIMRNHVVRRIRAPALLGPPDGD